MRALSEEFLADVAGHRLIVLHNDGLYRHLRFKAMQNGWHMWFDLVTWPGHLTVNGDMGTWTFARMEDMFNFFRQGDKLTINPDYWAGKSRHGTNGGRNSCKEWDADLFRERLTKQLSEYYSYEGADLAVLTKALRDDVLGADSRCDLFIAAREFSYRFADGRTFQFDLCELPTGEDYSYQFRWCLYGIVWGIQQYDKLQSANAEKPQPASESAEERQKQKDEESSK